MNFTIKKACEELGLTVHTIRHYCDNGLVPNLQYDTNGNRLFDRESLNWLKAATFLRASGLSIPEIRHYFELCLKGKETITERMKMMEKLKDQSVKELELAQYRVDCITEKLKVFQGVIEGTCEDDCNPLNW